MSESRVPIAIAHDYLTQRGGAEKVVLAMHRAFPDAPIYTTLYEPASTFPEFAGLDIRTSPLNRIGLLRRNHRLALPVLAFAASRMRVDADTVVVSSSGWAHGFRATGRKIVYCYSPARWLYQADRYLGSDHGARRAALRVLAGPLRHWDRRAAATADSYLAISTAVRGRVLEAYGIDATVLPAPHSVDPRVAAALPAVGDAPFYLCVSRLLPYKNVGAIVEAFRSMPDLRLVVVGTGPEEQAITAALPPNSIHLKNLTDAELGWLYAGCAGVVAASHEDYGLTPIEAAAHGKPSAVLRWGGFIDTVQEGVTGVFFDAPEAVAIAAAVRDLSSHTWDADIIRESAGRFDEAHFAAGLELALRRLAAA